MQKYLIDLFSDTNCSLSEGMRQYMMEAPVGNEVAQEDPTVNVLLEKVCTILGKEAAVFLPSGMMCNAISFLLMRQRPGDSVIIHETAHPLHMCSGVLSGLAQLSTILMRGVGGMFTAAEVAAVCRGRIGRNIPHICGLSVEQPTNFGGGRIWPLDQLKAVCSIAKDHNILTHMDGARLMTAVAATGIPPAVYAEPFDLVWIDFAKGLGAPMGAVLAGTHQLIEEAWYYKFQLGGGLHKAGILAAACLYALEQNLSKLNTLNERAKDLAIKLSKVPHITIDPSQVETNIAYFKLTHPKIDSEHFCNTLASIGIRVHNYQEKIRAITHLDTSRQDIEVVVEAVKKILS